MWSHIQTDGSGDLSPGLECAQVATETSQSRTRCFPIEKNRAAGQLHETSDELDCRHSMYILEGVCF